MDFVFGYRYLAEQAEAGISEALLIQAIKAHIITSEGAAYLRGLK